MFGEPSGVPIVPRLCTDKPPGILRHFDQKCLTMRVHHLYSGVFGSPLRATNWTVLDDVHVYDSATHRGPCILLMVGTDFASHFYLSEVKIGSGISSSCLEIPPIYRGPQIVFRLLKHKWIFWVTKILDNKKY